LRNFSLWSNKFCGGSAITAPGNTNPNDATVDVHKGEGVRVMWTWRAGQKLDFRTWTS